MISAWGGSTVLAAGWSYECPIFATSAYLHERNLFMPFCFLTSFMGKEYENEIWQSSAFIKLKWRGHPRMWKMKDKGVGDTLFQCLVTFVAAKCDWPQLCTAHDMTHGNSRIIDLWKSYILVNSSQAKSSQPQPASVTSISTVLQVMSSWDLFRYIIYGECWWWCYLITSFGWTAPSWEPGLALLSCTRCHQSI